jgi:hypothetical protein
MFLKMLHEWSKLFRKNYVNGKLVKIYNKEDISCKVITLRSASMVRENHEKL